MCFSAITQAFEKAFLENSKNTRQKTPGKKVVKLKLNPTTLFSIKHFLNCGCWLLFNTNILRGRIEGGGGWLLNPSVLCKDRWWVRTYVTDEH